jgi:hypothetical protein
LNHTSGPIAYTLAPSKTWTEWTYDPNLDHCRCIVCSERIVTHLSSARCLIFSITYTSSKPAIYGIPTDHRVGVIPRWSPWQHVHHCPSAISTNTSRRSIQLIPPRVVRVLTLMVLLRMVLNGAPKMTIPPSVASTMTLFWTKLD